MPGKLAIVIAGPTGIGKTQISHRLAIKYNGEIVSADSRTVYRFMDIATSKPPKQFREEIHYHLIDIKNPDEPFSIAEFIIKAREALQGIFERGRMPFVVGGCGLYIKRLVDGLFSSPPPSKALRESLEKEENLYERLKTIDEEAAGKISPNDKKRIIRALEVFYQTNTPISILQKEKTKPPAGINFILFCLDCERKVLYEMINKRVDMMIKDGLIDETKRLISLGYHPPLISMEGIGYKEIAGYLKGAFSLPDAIEAIKRRTRQFAKRQLTWFRNDKRYKFVKKEKAEGEISKVLSGIH